MRQCPQLCAESYCCGRPERPWLNGGTGVVDGRHQRRDGGAFALLGQQNVARRVHRLQTTRSLDWQIRKLRHSTQPHCGGGFCTEVRAHGQDQW